MGTDEYNLDHRSMDAMRQPPPPPPVMHANVDAAGSRIRRRLRAAALWWARRCCSYSPAPAAAAGEEEEEEQVRADWSGLPEDLMLIAMASMEVLDLISCGLVCSSWRTAYKTFRRLRLPTPPNQPPCLLYAPRPVISDEEDGPPRTMMLYSPSTDVTLCLRRPSRLRPLCDVAGSAYGCLFATDEAANPYLVNPLTGAEVALPPITTLERVNGGFIDADGGIVYYVEHGLGGNSPDTRSVTAQMAREGTYQRVAISAGSAAGGAACVVLLVHMPYWEVSFARVGDDRWTSISHQLRASFVDIIACMDAMQITAAAAAAGNLFYLMSCDGFVYVLDLTGPAPVLRSRTKVVRYLEPFRHSYYLVVAPSGDLLLVTRRLRREHGNDGYQRRITTTEIYVEKIDLEARKRERLAGIGKEHALFLGHGSPVWVPAAKEEDGGHPLLRPNCVYLTDDSYQSRPAITREDLVVWDFGSSRRRRRKKLARAWPHLYPWLDEPAPIWITPSLY